MYNFWIFHGRSSIVTPLIGFLLRNRWQRPSIAIVSLPSGTTLAECKSGYGLDTQNEIKMLRVLEAAKKKSAVEISSTFCGAHSVPKLVKKPTLERPFPPEDLPECTSHLA